MNTDVVYGEASDFFAPVRGTLADDLGITASTTDDELNALAAAEFEMARDQGQIVSGIFSYLCEIRDSLR